MRDGYTLVHRVGYVPRFVDNLLQAYKQYLQYGGVTELEHQFVSFVERMESGVTFCKTDDCTVVMWKFANETLYEQFMEKWNND